MAKIKTGDIRVRGLAQLSKALRSMDKGLQRELRDANKDAATLAARGAKSRALSEGGSLAKGARSIRASAGVRSASLGFGGATAPWMGGAEFGAAQNVERHRSTGTYVGYRQFRPWRGSGPTAGYAIYPSIRDNSEEIVDTYADALDDLIGRNFPD